MNADEFWATIEASRVDLDVDDPVAATEAQLAALREQLGVLDVGQLLAFQQRLHEQSVRANDWRLWAAGYLAAGGMSDDAFDYFRLWLVLRGPDAFDRVLADPDHLADLAWDAEGADFEISESLGYLVPELLDERGADPGDAVVSATASGELAGEQFDEDDDEWFAVTFPRLWARTAVAADTPGNRSEQHGGTGADATVFVDWTTRAKAPRAVQPMPPLLAAVLFENGEILQRDRPMVAAHWLADDLGGEAVLELASLRGNEPEVSELWPLALAEVGVALPVTRARVAAAWAAQRVVDRERDSFWLAEFLRPRSPETGDDPLLDQLARDLYAAVLQGRTVRGTVEALARDDLSGALRQLEEREG